MAIGGELGGPYAYAKNSPLAFTDPLGLRDDAAFGKGLGALGSGIATALIAGAALASSPVVAPLVLGGGVVTAGLGLAIAGAAPFVAPGSGLSDTPTTIAQTVALVAAGSDQTKRRLYFAAAAQVDLGVALVSRAPSTMLLGVANSLANMESGQSAIRSAQSVGWISDFSFDFEIVEGAGRPTGSWGTSKSQCLGPVRERAGMLTP